MVDGKIRYLYQREIFMNKIKFMAIIFMLTLLGACVSSGGKEDSSSGSDLSGHVSSVLNFLNPINTAHASDSTICTPVLGNDKVRIYTINPDDGYKTLACSTHLASDNSFNAKIFNENIPSGHHLKIEADFGGVVREAVFNKRDMANVAVDPSSTISVPFAIEKLKDDESTDPKSVREKVKNFVESSGVITTSISAQDVAKLKMIFESSLDSAKECIFDDGPRKDQFIAFLNKRVEDANVNVSGDDDVEASARSYLQFK